MRSIDTWRASASSRRKITLTFLYTRAVIPAFIPSFNRLKGTMANTAKVGRLVMAGLMAVPMEMIFSIPPNIRLAYSGMLFFSPAPYIWYSGRP